MVRPRLKIFGARKSFGISGIPSGIRTRVAALKGQSPRPLDDGDLGRGTAARAPRPALMYHKRQPSPARQAVSSPAMSEDRLRYIEVVGEGPSGPGEDLEEAQRAAFQAARRS